MLRHLDGGEAADVADPYGVELADREAGEANARHEVVVLPVGAREALVEQADAVEHRARHDPEAAVEDAKRLPEALALADHERARDGVGDAEVVDVALVEPAVVVDDGDVVAGREPEADVDVVPVAGAVVHDDDPLALRREGSDARPQGRVDLVVERPVRDHDAEPPHRSISASPRAARRPRRCLGRASAVPSPGRARGRARI